MTDPDSPGRDVLYRAAYGRAAELRDTEELRSPYDNRWQGRPGGEPAALVAEVMRTLGLDEEARDLTVEAVGDFLNGRRPRR